MGWQYVTKFGDTKFVGRKSQDITPTITFLFVLTLVSIFGYSLPIIVLSASLFLMSVYIGYINPRRIEYQFQPNDTLNGMENGSSLSLLGYRSMVDKDIKYGISVEKVRDEMFNVYSFFGETKKKMLVMRSSDIIVIEMDSSDNMSLLVEIRKIGGEAARTRLPIPKHNWLKRLFMLRMYPKLDVASNSGIVFQLINVE